MTNAEELYHEIASKLPNTTKGKMFGALCIKAANGKALAMFWKEYMIFKLDGEAQKDALSLDGASVFTPAEGRPMNGWILVPYSYANQWQSLAEQALSYVKDIKK
jgi:hypothetical protein